MSTYNFRPNYGDAVVSLSGGKALGGPADGPVGEWQFIKGATPPLEEDIQTKKAELQAEYDAQEYARNRASAYPSMGDQMDMIYKDTKNSTTTHADAVEAVKTKWPKDNSGPK